MSEDVKPKQFWVYMGDHALLASSLPVSFNDGTHVYHVIELEPTMRLIDELAEVLKFYLDIKPFPDDGAKAFLALEKYKKFKEVLR